MKPPATKPTMSTASATNGMSAVPTGATDPSVQVCAECAGKGKGASVAGTAVVKNGVQVVDIAIQGGYYVPNKITVKAGMPVQVVFTGKAKGCIAKPMFKSLGKKGDVTATGTAALDLGTLQPGSYAFTCAMGMGDGQIVAQ
jgi:plastocyanin domain-containing protein